MVFVIIVKGLASLFMATALIMQIKSTIEDLDEVGERSVKLSDKVIDFIILFLLLNEKNDILLFLLSHN